jgi:predicted alpha/beta superfamily hydrolase
MAGCAADAVPVKPAPPAATAPEAPPPVVEQPAPPPPDPPVTEDPPRVTDVAPAAKPFPIEVAGQTAWVHDEGSPAGYFHTYDALALGTPRKVHVFLPRSYPKGSFRVLYMNDGNTAFFPGGVGSKTWGVDARLAELRGAIPDLIVVAVHPLERDREYTHAPAAPGRACCGLAEYTRYLADTLKPFIDAQYRTRPEAKSTAIVGSSHGGLAAFYVAASRPDRFGAAGALSSSFWVGIDGGTDASLETSRLLASTRTTLADAQRRPRLWIDWGLVRTGGAHNSWIEERATARGREMAALRRERRGYGTSELFVTEDPAGEHDEISWGRRFPDVMRALWREP